MAKLIDLSFFVRKLIYGSRSARGEQDLPEVGCWYQKNFALGIIDMLLAV